MPVPAIIYALGGLVLLAGGAAFCQGVAAARDRKKYPAPGRLVDVGGYRLHINCTGVKDGRAPAVILEAAAASWSAFWCLVQPEIARITRVCSYDRAGLGWSDPGPSPRTSQQIADELHRLLTSAAIEPPYILVGHSLGGYHTRLFASRFSEEVAGSFWLTPHTKTKLLTSPRETRSASSGSSVSRA